MSEINASDSHTAITARLGEFPLRAEFSLEPLVRYWENELADDDCLLGSAARVILDRVKQVPELRARTITLETVRAHQDLVDALMVAVFAPSFQEQSYAAAMLPFRLQTFFATEAFSRLLAGPDGYLTGRIDADASLLAQVRIIHAYSLIIERVYGLDAGIEFPWITIVKDPETGLERHFKLLLEPRFLEVDVIGAAPPPRARARSPRPHEGPPPREVRDPRLLRGAGHRGDGAGSAVLHRARSHREGVHRLDRALPRPPGQDARPPAPARGRPGPGRGGGGAGPRPPLRLALRARVHLRRLDPSEDKRLQGLGLRASGHGAYAHLHRGPGGLSEPLPRGGGNARLRLSQRGGGAPHLPGPDHRQPQARVSPRGLPQRGVHAASPPDPAPLRHGGEAQHGRARQSHPGGDQGEVHGHPSRGGVALPQGRAEQPGGRDGRDGADRVPRRPSLLCPGGYPRILHQSGVVHPGRPSAPAGPRPEYPGDRPSHASHGHPRPAAPQGGAAGRGGGG